MEMSKYYNSLNALDKQIYEEKVALIGCDPYLVSLLECTSDVNAFPKTLYPDLVYYFIHKKDVYSFEQMKTYKNLEAYDQAKSGWVKQLYVREFENDCLVLGKVMHSQRLSKKLLSPWAICKKDGEILAAHCDCTAGLDGSCTHVAAILFAVDDAVRKLEGKYLAYWVPPTNRPPESSRIKDTDLFVKQKGTEILNKRVKSGLSYPKLKPDELQFLLTSPKGLQGCVMQTLVEPFSSAIAEMLEEKKRYIMGSFFKVEYEKLSLEELQEIGCSLDLHIPNEACKSITKDTEQQSKSWYAYRAGRITSSVFKAVCNASLNRPSVSLIKRIVYPTPYKTRLKAMVYGCNHEATAAKDFLEKINSEHRNLKGEHVGFIINPQYPYFGTSPDLIVECDCCGKGLIELKCSYCARERNITVDRKFFLNFKDGEVCVTTNHAYYYQTQMQLAVTGFDYCYLVAWSKNEMAYLKITADNEFWDHQRPKAETFFFKVLMPEILGKYFSREISVQEIKKDLDCSELNVEYNKAVDFYEDFYDEIESSEPEKINPCGQEHEVVDAPTTSQLIQLESENPNLYCFCQSLDDGVTPMIACESGHCKIGWFHLECVSLDLENIPFKWTCSDCKSVS